VSFRLPRAARSKFFKDLEFDVAFDIYYLCLMVGLAGGRKQDLPNADGVDVVDYFPGDYGKRANLIVALFLARELKSLGIEMSDRKAVQGAVAKLISTTTATRLSDEGLRVMNKYAFGGYSELIERFQERPRALEIFLPSYWRLMAELGARDND